ncbi:MAG: DNA alkylation repair protein, partial [Palaeococcus sp.]|uniref:DNA alkylation repair protein n=1 Tax=Palaeococcus sp. (in: euryarchaeotes) TaxID=2820298 RepID=UPI0025D7B99C
MIEHILKILASLRDKRNVEGMKRFGITSSSKILGVPKPKLRELAKKKGKNHELALKLWDSNIH